PGSALLTTMTFGSSFGSCSRRVLSRRNRSAAGDRGAWTMTISGVTTSCRGTSFPWGIPSATLWGAADAGSPFGSPASGRDTRGNMPKRSGVVTRRSPREVEGEDGRQDRDGDRGERDVARATDPNLAAGVLGLDSRDAHEDGDRNGRAQALLG